MARKYFPHNSIIFCSSRVEEGLPLVCAHNMNFIINGILAKATSIYEVELCHYIFMGNHFHMILRVINPEHIQAFFRYIKTEIAHAINRLLGRRKKTVWTDRYDSPIILDSDKLKEMLIYLYLNPADANLVESIEEYPGVSSWKMFKYKIRYEKHKKVPRNRIKKLQNASLTVSEQKDLVEIYKSHGKEYELKIEPLKCFDILGLEVRDFHEILVKQIHEEELKLKKARKFEVLGITRLRRQSMLKEHIPKKYSPKMICLSTDKELRKTLIGHFKYLCYLASKVYNQWKIGELSYKIPSGLYPPRMPSLSSAL